MEPIRLTRVLDFIGYANFPRFLKENDPLLRSQRPAMSAGALHEIFLVLVPPQGTRRAFVYDPIFHSLRLPDIVSPSALEQFWKKCRTILPNANGTAIVLLGDLARVSAVYENPHSLLWRNAGALLQTLALVATGYNIAFCPTGILGDEIIEAMTDTVGLVAVGACLVGQTPPP